MKKIALYGPVGAGKSTLLKMIVGLVEPDKGKITLGDGIEIGYYSQELEDLNSYNSVLEEMLTVAPSLNETKLRTVLGSFLFTQHDVYKKVSVLSHGERCRLALAKIAFSKPNFLVLDEPSNHLDVTSKRLVAQALQSYQGTLLVASHDDDLLNRIGLNKIVLLPEGEIKTL